MEVLLQPWVYIYDAQKNCLIEKVHLVPTTYVIVENILSEYTDFFAFQRYKLYRGIIWFLESV